MKGGDPILDRTIVDNRKAITIGTTAGLGETRTMLIASELLAETSEVVVIF